MLARIFSTILLWAATLLAIAYFDSLGWAVLIAILSAAALREALCIMRKMGLSPSGKIAQCSSAAIIAGAFFGMSIETPLGGAIAFSLCAAASACLLIRDPRKELFSKTLLPTLAAVCAIPFMLHWLVVIGSSGSTRYGGIVLAIWILAAAKFSDVGAYVIGSAFGRHKMAPSISPKKTWEGAAGGVFSSAAVSAAIACGFSEILPPQFTPPIAALAGAAIGAVAILSDLLESIFKRAAGVKDSGAAIPGIGGALDLADSVLLSAPAGTFLLSAILLTL